jgi:hypothetical protein
MALPSCALCTDNPVGLPLIVVRMQEFREGRATCMFVLGLELHRGSR